MPGEPDLLPDPVGVIHIIRGCLGNCLFLSSRLVGASGRRQADQHCKKKQNPAAKIIGIFSKAAILVETCRHFSSLSREELAETGEEAGFLTYGSLPGISPSPF